MQMLHFRIPQQSLQYVQHHSQGLRCAQPTGERRYRFLLQGQLHQQRTSISAGS